MILTTGGASLPGGELHPCYLAGCSVRLQGFTQRIRVTFRGAVVIHTAIEIDAWVKELMAGLENLPQQCVTLLVGLLLLLVITGPWMIRKGDAPGGGLEESEHFKVFSLITNH